LHRWLALDEGEKLGINVVETPEMGNLLADIVAIYTVVGDFEQSDLKSDQFI